MPVLREILEVPQEPDIAFDAVADFSSSAQWDPGVAAAERVGDGATAPDGVGAVYRLTVTFRGRASEMTYRTAEYRRPDLVVLEGIGPRIAATDTIEFSPIDGGGTRITYVADLRLIGPREGGGAFPRTCIRRDGHTRARRDESVVRRESRAPGMIMSEHRAPR